MRLTVSNTCRSPTKASSDAPGLHIAPSPVHRWFYRATMRDPKKPELKPDGKTLALAALCRVRTPVDLAPPPRSEQVGACFAMQHPASNIRQSPLRCASGASAARQRQTRGTDPPVVKIAHLSSTLNGMNVPHSPLRPQGARGAIQGKLEASKIRITDIPARNLRDHPNCSDLSSTCSMPLSSLNGCCKREARCRDRCMQC